MNFRVNIPVFLIWTGWFFIAGSLYLIYINDNWSEKVGSLALAFLLISEVIILNRKNKAFEQQTRQRFKLSLDVSHVQYNILKERNKILFEQYIKCCEDDSSSDVDELSSIKARVTSVFE